VKLPIDTSAIAFLCAMAPEPVADFETKRPPAPTRTANRSMSSSSWSWARTALT
jgi:hypothetical protein